jgi:hypothetical protein
MTNVLRSGDNQILILPNTLLKERALKLLGITPVLWLYADRSMHLEGLSLPYPKTHSTLTRLRGASLP